MRSPFAQCIAQGPARAWRLGWLALWLMAAWTALLAQPLVNDPPLALPVGASPGALVTVNAASYIPQLAPGAIAALFGNRLTEQSQLAETVPLPTELNGLGVRLVDSQNAIFSAALFFISPGQINYLIPDQIALGEARIFVIHETAQETALVAQGKLLITNSAPALFTFAANGKGEPAALITNDGETYYTVRESDGGTPDSARRPTYLLLFGTGFRYAQRLRVKLGTRELKPLYAGAQGLLAGLDQINLALPPDTPPGLLNLQIISDGYASNLVQVRLTGD
jgi:uncharacterized protein (TIGR03437 family)